MSAGVLAVMDEARERFVNLRELAGFGDSDLTPKLDEARATVAELIEAARRYATRYCSDEASTNGVEATGCSQQQHDDAVSLFAAIDRAGGFK